MASDFANLLVEEYRELSRRLVDEINEMERRDET
jgi:hypothetical protein